MWARRSVRAPLEERQNPEAVRLEPAAVPLRNGSTRVRRRAQLRRRNRTNDESNSISSKVRKAAICPPSSLYLNLHGNGKSAARAERLRCDLQNRRRLLALVLRALHQPHHLLDEVERKTALRGDALRRLIPLHVGLDNRIEDFIWRQRIGIFLARPEFCRRRLLQNRRGNYLAFPVDPVAHRIHPRLYQIANDRECPHHVAIERAITHRHLGLVARGKDERTELVRQRHH